MCARILHVLNIHNIHACVHAYYMYLIIHACVHAYYMCVRYLPHFFLSIAELLSPVIVARHIRHTHKPTLNQSPSHGSTSIVAPGLKEHVLFVPWSHPHGRPPGLTTDHTLQEPRESGRVQGGGDKALLAVTRSVGTECGQQRSEINRHYS